MDTKCLQALVSESFSFLAEYEWIHSFPVTRILREVSKVPDEWSVKLRQLSAEELNHLPFEGTSSDRTKAPDADWPLSLQQFLSRAASLSVARGQKISCQPTNLQPAMAKGMNPKKRHEVAWMASLVDQVVKDAKCHLILDIGSGLGYVDHVLHQVYGHPVLGLETSHSHTSAAEARATQQGISCGGVVNRKFDISASAECFQELDQLLRREAPGLTCHCPHREAAGERSRGCAGENGELRVCLIGLHCCGDLSTSVLSLFDHSQHVQALCMVSCCYHKMAFSDNKFDNFPFSQAGTEQYRQLSESCPPCPVSPCTLRLGAQETKCRWRSQTEADHARHTRHVAYRALLELTDSASCVVRERVRKCDFSNFDAFVASYVPGNRAQDDVQREISALKDLYGEHEDKFALIEPFTCLQVIVQPVVESLLYRDRLLWLRERGHDNAHIVPVFDDLISPRNLALIASKDRSMPIKTDRCQ